MPVVGTMLERLGRIGPGGAALAVGLLQVSLWWGQLVQLDQLLHLGRLRSVEFVGIGGVQVSYRGEARVLACSFDSYSWA